ncbi:MAG: hypothetical protein CFH12_00635 [Alphaproteobacteria bacterium MarineAlpha5_Bin2]|jgi:uncharacterized Ntn-hydrolase superfamily protein|nr:DUF1028 domain-containing protein [Alphaproteobacteria bacterium]PPR53868.1 MAG: hypothetical protein CFH12_00635 [Alphaproteobacteria bacterium MarineAlpha5_Bin2]
MTFSIVASNPSTKELCVATSTGLVAVGNLVPSILPNVGAICVQAMVKPSYRETILDLMKNGSSNESAINNVLKNDKKKEHRQIIVVNAKGQTYVFSGLRMINICDSCMEDNFAIAGNMLASGSVISSMKKAFLINSNVFFPKRLLLTLIAGENAGGDKRGCLSAAIEYFKPNRRIMTLRIDYSNNSLKDLSMALEKRYSKECKDAFDR